MNQKELEIKILAEFTKLKVRINKTSATFLSRIERIDDKVLTPDSLEVNPIIRPDFLIYPPHNKQFTNQYRNQEKKEMITYLSPWIQIDPSLLVSFSSTSLYSLIEYCEKKSGKSQNNGYIA